MDIHQADSWIIFPVKVGKSPKTYVTYLCSYESLSYVEVSLKRNKSKTVNISGLWNAETLESMANGTQLPVSQTTIKRLGIEDLPMKPFSKDALKFRLKAQSNGTTEWAKFKIVEITLC